MLVCHSFGAKEPSLGLPRNVQCSVFNVQANIPDVVGKADPPDGRELEPTQWRKKAPWLQLSINERGRTTSLMGESRTNGGCQFAKWFMRARGMNSIHFSFASPMGTGSSNNVKGCVVLGHRGLGACQPPDGDQMLDGVKFRIACQDRSRKAAGRGDTKGIRIGDRMLTLDFRRLSHQR